MSIHDLKVRKEMQASVKNSIEEASQLLGKADIALTHALHILDDIENDFSGPLTGIERDLALMAYSMKDIINEGEDVG
jgi:uncharacterized protein (UPF0147 family)